MLHPEAALHAYDAITTKNILNYGEIDRPGAAGRRARNLATRGLPSIPIYDRDEFPPAMLIPAGRVSVEYVRFGDNRGAGSSIRHQLSRYPNGTNVIVLPINVPASGTYGNGIR